MSYSEKKNNIKFVKNWFDLSKVPTKSNLLPETIPKVENRSIISFINPEQI